MSVYTHVSESEFIELLSHYDLGDFHSYEGIKAGITNTNYFLTTQTDTQNYQQFVFTVFEQDSVEDLHYFLELKAFLRGKGILCPMPMADKEGGFLRSLQGKPVAIVEKLSGHTVENIDTFHCQIIGKALANLHQASSDFPLRRKNNRGQAWRRETFKVVEEHLSADDRRLLEQQLILLEQADFSGLPTSVVHCDLFWDNVLFYNEGQNTQLGGLIDFYYACDDICLYDIAIVANDWCTDKQGKFEADKLSALLQAYNNERAFTQDEKDQWHNVLIMASLRFWLSRLHDKIFPKEGDLTFTKDPNEIKHILEHHLSQTSKSLECFI